MTRVPPCAELDWEQRGSRELSAEERAHVQQCPRCQTSQALWRALLASGGTGPSSALSAQIREAAHQALAATPRAASPARTFARAAGLALVPGLLAALAVHRRPDWTLLPQGGIALTLALLALAFVLAGRAAFAPGLFPRGRPLAAAGAAVGALALLLFPGPHGGVAGGAGLGCFVGVLGASSLPLLLLFGLLRGRTRSALAGWCAGLAAGALGEATLFLHCPGCGLGHLCRAHLSAWLVVGVLGAALLLLFPERIWKPAGRRG